MSAPSGGFSGGSSETQNQNRNPHQQQRQPFTKEEVLVLKECNSESFWYRCVPIGLGMMGGSQYLVNSGVLKPHPRFGALFKNFAALSVGYIIGKVSYQGTCKQKILDRIPDSKLAHALRKQGPMNFYPDVSNLPPMMSPESTTAPTERRDEMRSSDFDMDKTPNQTPVGLDDSKRPTMDKEGFLGPGQTDNEANTPSFKSYDDLRRQNRMDYGKKAATNESPFNQRPWPPPSPPPSSQTPPRDLQGPWQGQSSERGYGRKGKNKYGDELGD